jgi:hypothetical protein
MDVNLTREFLGMPVNLVGKATQDVNITDWLPLVAVILTAIFTYYITTTIQERYHRKELKRQVYFELIEVITQAKKIFEDNRINPVSEDPDKDVERKDKEIEIATAFIAAKFKAYVGGSKEFNALLDATLPVDVLQSSNLMTFQSLMKKLTDQMTGELIQPTFMDQIIMRVRAGQITLRSTSQKKSKK